MGKWRTRQGLIRVEQSGMLTGQGDNSSRNVAGEQAGTGRVGAPPYNVVNRLQLDQMDGI